jgi:hypothetical protein
MFINDKSSQFEVTADVAALPEHKYKNRYRNVLPGKNLIHFFSVMDLYLFMWFSLASLLFIYSYLCFCFSFS